MTTESPRRPILRFACAWFMLPLTSFAATGPLDNDPLDPVRPRGEPAPPRDPGYGAPAGPLRPAPQDVHPPKPGPADRSRREPGWRPPVPVRRPKLPTGLPKPELGAPTA